MMLQYGAGHSRQRGCTWLSGMYWSVRDRPRAGPEWKIMYSVPASELRKELFAMMADGAAAETAVAEDCLIAIDQMRDD